MYIYHFIPVLNRSLDKIIEDYKLPIGTKICLTIDTHDLDLNKVKSPLDSEIVHPNFIGDLYIHPDDHKLVRSRFYLVYKGEHLTVVVAPDGHTFHLDDLTKHIKPVNGHILVRYKEPESIVCRKYLYIEFNRTGAIKRMLTYPMFFTSRDHFKHLLGEYGISLEKGDIVRYRIITKLKERKSKDSSDIYHPSMGKCPLDNYAVVMHRLL